jgi:hypothetical protein
MRCVTVLLALFLSACAPIPWPADTSALVYLTWQGDPTTTMTVQWLAGAGATGADVRFVRVGDTAVRTVTGQRRPLAHSDRLVHTAELTGLQPGRAYRFRIDGLADEFTFRTMPADADRPITFIVGGDIYRGRKLDERMFRTAASRDPMFIVLGGDIVYDNGDPERVGRWYRFLDAWQRCMITTDGHLIPVVAAIGNHEVVGQFDKTPDQAPFFYALFPGVGDDGTQVLDFGDYLSIVLLDSDHTHPVAGAQAAWLDETLAARSGVPHLFAVYHVPAYPCVRRYAGGRSEKVREHWTPLFDRHGVDVAYEHHDHAYKRTPLIKEGRADHEGVLYLGDGAWGVPARGVRRPQETWYLERAESVNNVIVTTIHRAERTHTALDPDGGVIDSYPSASDGPS